MIPSLVSLKYNILFLFKTYITQITREPVKLAKQVAPIWHQDSERVTYVGGELADSAPVYAVLDLDKKLDELSFRG